jgi:hypothetical protein
MAPATALRPGVERDPRGRSGLVVRNEGERRCHRAIRAVDESLR